MKNYILYFLIIFFFKNTFAQEKESSTFLEIDSSKIYVKTIGIGDPVIIIHGGPGLAHNYLYDPFQENIKNYKLIFYDQRGSGLSSEIKNEERVTVDDLVSDLESLRKKLNVKNLNLIGQSWGAIVAINYAEKYSHHIKKLLLLEPAPISSDYMQAIQNNVLNRLSTSRKDSLVKLSPNPLLTKDVNVFKNF